MKFPNFIPIWNPKLFTLIISRGLSSTPSSIVYISGFGIRRLLSQNYGAIAPEGSNRRILLVEKGNFINQGPLSTNHFRSLGMGSRLRHCLGGYSDTTTWNASKSLSGRVLSFCDGIMSFSLILWPCTRFSTAFTYLNHGQARTWGFASQWRPGLRPDQWLRLSRGNKEVLVSNRYPSSSLCPLIRLTLIYYPY